MTSSMRCFLFPFAFPCFFFLSLTYFTLITINLSSMSFMFVFVCVKNKWLDTAASCLHINLHLSFSPLYSSLSLLSALHNHSVFKYKIESSITVCLSWTKIIIIIIITIIIILHACTFNLSHKYYCSCSLLQGVAKKIFYYLNLNF